jgi:hypothetical protein
MRKRKHSDDISAAPCPKIPSSETVNVYEVSTMVQASSLNLSLITTLTSSKVREELSAHSQINKVKSEQLKLSYADLSTQS